MTLSKGNEISGDKDCPNDIYENEWDTFGLKGSDWVSLSNSKKLLWDDYIYAVCYYQMQQRYILM